MTRERLSEYLMRLLNSKGFEENIVILEDLVKEAKKEKELHEAVRT